MRTVYFAPTRRSEVEVTRRAVADVVAVAADRRQAGDALAAREPDAGVDGAARGAREAVGGELEGRVVGVDLDHRRLAAEAGAVGGGGVGRGGGERGGARRAVVRAVRRSMVGLVRSREEEEWSTSISPPLDTMSGPPRWPVSTPATPMSPPALASAAATRCSAGSPVREKRGSSAVRAPSTGAAPRVAALTAHVTSTLASSATTPRLRSASHAGSPPTSVSSVVEDPGVAPENDIAATIAYADDDAGDRARRVVTHPGRTSESTAAPGTTA